MPTPPGPAGFRRGCVETHNARNRPSWISLSQVVVVKVFTSLSRVAQWQSIRLLIEGLLVRVQPREPPKTPESQRKARDRGSLLPRRAINVQPKKQTASAVPRIAPARRQGFAQSADPFRPRGRPRRRPAPPQRETGAPHGRLIGVNRHNRCLCGVSLGVDPAVASAPVIVMLILQMPHQFPAF